MELRTADSVWPPETLSSTFIVTGCHLGSATCWARRGGAPVALTPAVRLLALERDMLRPHLESISLNRGRY